MTSCEYSEEKFRQAQWLIYQADPWTFIKRECLTIDEADSGKVKHFPDKEYLKHIVETWQKHDILAIPKTRRMMLTWIFLALHLWAAIFHPNVAIFVQSKKADDSDFLIGEKRMKFIYDNLPQWLKQYISCERKQYQLTFSNGSWVKAIGQGPDQMRSYTASYVMLDEVAFWEWAAATWGSLKPTIDGGGKVVLISSAGPGFFRDLVKGEME
jgi:hypothetical protein